MMTKEKLKAEIVDAITCKGEICVNDIVKICRKNHARWRGTKRLAVIGYPNALLLADLSDTICEAILELGSEQKIKCDPSWEHMAEDEPYFELPRGDFLVPYDTPYWVPSVFRLRTEP